MTIWKATYDSRNFSFESYSKTEGAAKKHLEAGLKRHAKQYGVRCDFYDAEDIDVREIEIGFCYRDREAI